MWYSGWRIGSYLQRREKSNGGGGEVNGGKTTAYHVPVLLRVYIYNLMCYSIHRDTEFHFLYNAHQSISFSCVLNGTRACNVRSLMASPPRLQQLQIPHTHICFAELQSPRWSSHLLKIRGSEAINFQFDGCTISMSLRNGGDIATSQLRVHTAQVAPTVFVSISKTSLLEGLCFRFSTQAPL